MAQLEQFSQQTAELNDSPQQDWLFGANLQNSAEILPLVELSKVELALQEIDPNELTPKQALEWLYKLKGLVRFNNIMWCNGHAMCPNTIIALSIN
ncbi:hypothetical protein [Ursidibacter maritimus]|uniref:hypothetical protein n=1 Tax=Ursidibacter maritimus TaxID=1331689 RepID=UPI003F6939B9|nr:hypothetical protein A1D26_02995 [Ursidibacter maritimus]